MLTVNKDKEKISNTNKHHTKQSLASYPLCVSISSVSLYTYVFVGHDLSIELVSKKVGMDGEFQ